MINSIMLGYLVGGLLIGVMLGDVLWLDMLFVVFVDFLLCFGSSDMDSGWIDIGSFCDFSLFDIDMNNW